VTRVTKQNDLRQYQIGFLQKTVSNKMFTAVAQITSISLLTLQVDFYFNKHLNNKGCENLFPFVKCFTIEKD